MMSSLSIIVMLYTIFPISHGMIDKYNNLKIGYEVRSIHQFKYDKGGNLEMNGYFIEPNEEQQQQQNEQEGGEEEEEEKKDINLNIYHCTDSEIENLNKYNSMHKLCEDLGNFECSYSLSINNENENNLISYSFNSLKKQWMTMIIISCSENTIYDISSLNIRATSKQQQIEYLSLNEINYKYIFLWLSIFYILIVLIYFFSIFTYRYFNISIQILLIFYPFLQFLLCIFSNLYWNYSSLHGLKSSDYLLLCYIFDAFCNGYLALILLFICFGWKFMNNKIEPNSFKIKIEIFCIISLIIISSILQNYYSSLLLLNVICYILCCRRMLKCYTNNIRLLQSQLEILSNLSPEVSMESPAQIKLNIFKFVQKLFILFISLKIIFYWISSLFIYEYPWINDIILNVINQIFIICLFYNFRMTRTFKPYFYLIDDQYDIVQISNYNQFNKYQKFQNINYNLSFQCDMLIIENQIDFIHESVIINYTLSTPYTIDLNDNKHQALVDGDAADHDEQTPLLLK